MRVFTDTELLTWESYVSGGKFGLPDRPKIIFHCLSDSVRRARYVEHEGDNATAARAVMQAGDDVLRQLLTESRELD